MGRWILMADRAVAGRGKEAVLVNKYSADRYLPMAGRLFGMDQCLLHPVFILISAGVLLRHQIHLFTLFLLKFILD